MIKKVVIKSFKSLESVVVELGQVNVFIGANGSGKSNFIEGLGVLSAAADGKVNDQMLLQRGVRPGVPKLYKSSFKGSDTRISPHIFFSAENDSSSYKISLHNPLKKPEPAWCFKTENWEKGTEKLVGRPPKKEAPNPEQGLAALIAVRLKPDDPALSLLKKLESYVIYTPTTSVLRGITIDSQPTRPVGLSGGLLADAIRELLLMREKSAHIQRVCRETLRLIDWAKSFGTAPAASLPISPSAAVSPRVIKFVDRFMREGRNTISSSDASEGALYVLFLAVLAAHPSSREFFAVDNFDHGLNPRLARDLITHFCDWVLKGTIQRQILLTTHNPLVLDGLPLKDDRVRLFTVSRTGSGRTFIRRIEIDDKLLAKAKEGWTLSRLWVMGHLGGISNV